MDGNPEREGYEPVPLELEEPGAPGALQRWKFGCALFAEGGEFGPIVRVHRRVLS